MKEKLQRFGRRVGEALMRTVLRHPVETVLIVCGCAGCMAAYELDNSDADALLTRLALVPMFVVLAFVAGRWTGHGAWRWFYRLCWLPLVPLALWTGLSEWVGSNPFRITLGILMPLALAAVTRARENRAFVGDAVVWVRSAVLAVLFANVALALFCAILYSTVYIFGIDGPWVGDTAMYALILCEVLAVPMLLLMTTDRWLGTPVRGSKIVDVLLNYIVTPALLVYVAILYIYIVKILVVRTLPEGGVAYMVFGFTIFAFIVKALQEMLGRRPFEWFFDWFGLIALPPAVLFWAGVARRVGEYGLTEERVWLIVCGGVMTLCLLLFLFKRTGRYLYIVAAAFVIFAVMAYVPALNPARIAVRSQAKCAERIAVRLGLLGSDGRLTERSIPEADTVRRLEYRRLYDALEYVEANRNSGGENLSEFALTVPGEFVELLPPALRAGVAEGRFEYDEPQSGQYMVLAPENRCVPVEGYRQCYMNLSNWAMDNEQGYTLENDTLYIRFGDAHPEFRIAGRELIETQLRRARLKSGFTEAEMDAAVEEFLTYSDREMTILFSSIEFCHRDTTLSVSRLAIDAVLLR